MREAVEALAVRFSLSEEERLELLPSGKYPTFNSRISWAGSYLNAAAMIERPRRGYMKITARGLSALKESPSRIDVKYLERYPEFVAFYQKAKGISSKPSESVPPNTKTHGSVSEPIFQTPYESIEEAHRSIRDSLADEILQQIKACSPEFFERLVVDVLVSMGYGGTRSDAGEVIGKSGDGGIDGTIKEDRLGLDVIYVQAKRWENTVGRPDIQQFAGALQGQKARKGVFITTSSFSTAAVDYARSIESSLVLVDGERLAELMIDHDVGVTLETSFEIKRMDSDYFEEV